MKGFVIEVVGLGSCGLIGAGDRGVQNVLVGTNSCDWFAVCSYVHCLAWRTERKRAVLGRVCAEVEVMV